ncbi:hypothetical protein GBAR_LOCUS21320 [Geodia barretti]|uniref:RWD domain-containing protein n=1 Tax=Geodia barretti TaxID=519541 RepID=A0AA35SZA9_GEOBA|nr:hypothetical protein GBAR_LOCUS21320 [Geodia barretti]
MSSVGEELSTLKDKISKIPNADVISCHPSLVQIKIRQTDHRQVNVCCQFPESYPSRPLLVELKSKTIADRMLEGMVKVFDQELLRISGQPQIVHLVRFVSEFLTNNPFVVCSEELNHVKHKLASEADTLKVKRKTGVILYKATQNRSASV